MSGAVTIYWTPQGWSKVSTEQPLTGAAGSDFSGKVLPGDRVFITNTKGGSLRILGAFTLERIQIAAKEGRPATISWDAKEYLIPRPGTATNLQFVELTADEVRGLFFSEGKPTVKIDAEGRVDGQTMRSIRRLSSESQALLESILSRGTETPRLTPNTRLPINVLEKVTPEHVRQAIEVLLEGRASHRFAPSTDYDLISDSGERLPPKAVFGIALSIALEREIGPEHFTGGVGSPCFRILSAAGYKILPKPASGTSPEKDQSPDQQDREWEEGNPVLKAHIKKERSQGLAKAKKADFKAKNGGRLFCERCLMDPVATFSSEHGEACIEVHHATTSVADMGLGYRTKLADLQCLCANCHRYVHRTLRA